jgi:hypothetical protein
MVPAHVAPLELRELIQGARDQRADRRLDVFRSDPIEPRQAIGQIRSEKRIVVGGGGGRGRRLVRGRHDGHALEPIILARIPRPAVGEKCRGVEEHLIARRALFATAVVLGRRAFLEYPSGFE